MSSTARDEKDDDDKDDDGIRIRPIRTNELDAFRAMRIEALCDCPLAFTADLGAVEARTIDEWRQQVARSTGDGRDLILIADAGPERGLAGMTGVFTMEQPKLAHVGTVWGVYVRPAFRGRGVGERLLRACIDWARAQGRVTLKLSVVVGNDAARRCYERVGFTAYGVEPLAVQWDGRLYDEILMVLRLH